MAISCLLEWCAQALKTQRTSSTALSLLQFAAVLFLTSLLFGCASTKESERKLAELSLENSILQEKNQQLAGEVIEQKNTVARLQMALVEKQVEINTAKSALKSPPSRGTENLQGRLPPPNSKAEAVTCLAEVETEINTVRESSVAVEESQDFSEVDDLLARSRENLSQGSYDEACILAYQALNEVHETRLKTVLAKRETPSIYTDFVEPLQLRTVKRCNIRSRPSISSKILETLASDTTVTAIGYRGNWIKVATGAGKTGWIFYNLLTVPIVEYNGKGIEADSIRDHHL